MRRNGKVLTRGGLGRYLSLQEKVQTNRHSALAMLGDVLRDQGDTEGDPKASCQQEICSCICSCLVLLCFTATDSPTDRSFDPASDPPAILLATSQGRWRTIVRGCQLWSPSTPLMTARVGKQAARGSASEWPCTTPASWSRQPTPMTKQLQWTRRGNFR